MSLCVPNVYLYSNGSEELLLRKVDVILPKNGKCYICSTTGEQKVIEADIKEITLSDHKIILHKK